MKHLITLCFTIAFLLPKPGMACSMYKLTKNGKIIVGNNEDYFSPNSQFWFEASAKNRFGVMYMGLLDSFAQGAINEEGLMFDGFFEPYLAVTNVEGKLKIPIGDALKKIMQTMTNVEIKYFSLARIIYLNELKNQENIDKLKKHWYLTKDEIDKCKICELRYSCFDCREIAYRKSKGDLYAKNPNCSYNTKTGFWNEEKKV